VCASSDADDVRPAPTRFDLPVAAAGYADSPAIARTPALFGRVMALVALTVGCATLGVWLARDWGGAAWFIAWLLSLGCLIGLNVANARGNTGLALALLVAFGLLIGASVATTVDYYADTDPVAVRQAFGATALFIAALGSGGYAVRRDLSFLYRLLFWLLLALLAAGIVLIFVDIPAADTAWALAGLAIFGLYTVVDFNRLRRAGTQEAIPLAAGIFLDVLNVFLLFLRLFGRSN
jgi:FtsH-binding integral membrane protein